MDVPSVDAVAVVVEATTTEARELLSLRITDRIINLYSEPHPAILKYDCVQLSHTQSPVSYDQKESVACHLYSSSMLSHLRKSCSNGTSKPYSPPF